MSGVLSLSTYPLRRPRHGGQRRVRAFGEFYRSIGVPFSYACVYEPANYSAEDVDADDLPLDFEEPALVDVPYVGDILSGLFAAKSQAAYDHFRALIDRLKPSAIQLDHPFMWPLVERLRAEGRFTGAIIYSSHNYEGPLKEDILLSTTVERSKAREVRVMVETLERRCVEAADVVVAVLESDAAKYRPAAARRGAPVIIVPNGVSRPPAPSGKPFKEAELFRGRPFCFFVGSAYPPNIEGFAELVAKGGLFFTPPEKSFAICGGVSEGIFVSREYGRFVAANSDRVHFFPDIADEDLQTLKDMAHVILLPIQFGGGSNLKTAEALASGKHVVATRKALRGFERFAGAAGVHYGDDTKSFRAAMIGALHAPPLRLSAAEMAERDSLYWDSAFARSGLAELLRGKL